MSFDIGADLQRAYDDGYEAGKRDAAPRWVRCEEELPKNVANRVLVYCENGATYVAHYEGGETDMWYANAGTWWEELTGHRKVTHWMPIEPPKEGE